MLAIVTRKASTYKYIFKIFIYYFIFSMELFAVRQAHAYEQVGGMLDSSILVQLTGNVLYLETFKGWLRHLLGCFS